MNKTVEAIGNATGQTGWRKTYARKWTPPAQPCGHWGKNVQDAKLKDLTAEFKYKAWLVERIYNDGGYFLASKPHAICQTQATAERISRALPHDQANDSAIKEIELLRHDGKWYGPVCMVEATDKDKRTQAEIDRIAAAAAAAEAAGLTKAQIDALRGSK
jgi:hypothetical protein